MLKRTKPSGWSPSSWGLELDQVHMKLEDIKGHKRGLELLQVGGSWVLKRHILQRFQS